MCYTLEVLQLFIHGVAQHLHLELSAVMTFKFLQGTCSRIKCCIICCRISNYLCAHASNAGVALSKSFGSYEASGVACAG